MSQDPIRYSGAWNFGPYDTNCINVLSLVKMAIQCWGEGSYIVNQKEDFHEAKYLQLDISKANNELGWIPKYGIDETIEKTVIGYKKLYSTNKNTEVFRFMMKEIDDYLVF